MVDIPEETYLSLLLSIRRTFTKSLRKEKGADCFKTRGAGKEQILLSGLLGKVAAEVCQRGYQGDRPTDQDRF